MPKAREKPNLKTALDPVGALIEMLTSDQPPASTLDVARKAIADGLKRRTDPERIANLQKLFEQRLHVAMGRRPLQASTVDVARKYLKDCERLRVPASGKGNVDRLERLAATVPAGFIPYLSDDPPTEP
jgi:hypothetical protein